MRHLRIPLLLLTVPAGALAQSPLALYHVSVIDATGSLPRSDRTVVVRGTRIVSVAPSRSAAIPAGARVIEGRGKFLLPGFSDMHVHTDTPEARRRLALAAAT